ncbi:FHA domain-containing protein [Streptomyces sp. NPDC015144]|uniref:FHA domain-containing protein n=1 Tax=Streptomyces sp. NPDC015144 TaxID=3364944 RepID=UPI0036F6C7B6
MPTCPNGHQSGSDDWCEVCGHRMTGAGAPAGAVPPPPPPPPAAGYGFPQGPGADATQQAELCPQCRTPREAMAPFCEECRWNYLTNTATSYTPLAPTPNVSGPPPGLNLPPGFQAQQPPGPARPRDPFEYQGSRPSQVNRSAEPLATDPESRPGPPPPLPGPGVPGPVAPGPGAPGPGAPGPQASPPPAPGPLVPPPGPQAPGPVAPGPQGPPPPPGPGGPQSSPSPFPQPGPPPPPPFQQQSAPPPPFQQQSAPPSFDRPGGPAPAAPQPPAPQGPQGGGDDWMLSPPTPAQAPPQQEQPPFPGQGQNPAPASWTAVIAPDREYFLAMMQRSGPEATGLNLPAYSPEQQLSLSGPQVTIGRRRQSTGESPDIDLSVPPEDPGVSHQHAVLVQQPGGGWAVVDQNSTNGTTLNGAEDPIQPYVPVPLKDGDRVHVGAWTTITIRRD